MKVSKETVEENRERVIDVAATLFRERGIDGIGIADLMAAAGLTHGGFYRHFKSKEDLVLQAVKRAYKDMSEDFARRLAGSNDPLQTLVLHYVSDHHRDDPGNGCSLASLAGDAARQTNPALKQFFGSIVSNYIELLTTLAPGNEPATKRAAAISILAEMVGSVVLSRATPNQKLSGEIVDTVSTDLVTRHRTSKSSVKQSRRPRPTKLK